MYIWICSIFIFPEEYWWIRWGGLAPKFCSSSFRDTLFWFLWRHSVLILSGYSDSGMGKTSTVHRGDFLGLETSMWRRMFCSVHSGRYAIHQSCQAIQYTQESQSYDYQFSIICTLHIHMLLTECHTYVYSYIVDGTMNTWVGGRALTFWSWRVYMSILML